MGFTTGRLSEIPIDFPGLYRDKELNPHILRRVLSAEVIAILQLTTQMVGLNRFSIMDHRSFDSSIVFSVSPTAGGAGGGGLIGGRRTEIRLETDSEIACRGRIVWAPVHAKICIVKKR